MAHRARSRRSESGGSTAGPWLVRIAVLAALAATIAFAGPRAWRVASAELRSEGHGGGVAVPLDRVSAFRAPDWLAGPLLRAMLEDLEPRMRGEVRLMDDAEARAARDRISASPFVVSARLERRFPDRFLVRLDVRRPEVQVESGGRVIALLDAEGTALPCGADGADAGLPRVDVDGYSPHVPIGAIRFGEPFPDLRIIAAASVAREWREEVAPEVADVGSEVPPLRSVDARNVGWQWIANGATSQILVGLGRSDGETVWFHYGLAEVDGGPVTAATRAEVLGRILEERPGLRGLLRGDLRLRNLWRDSLRDTGDAPAPQGR